MSSYLTIYVKLKNVEKPAPIISWSRNNTVYQALNGSIAYIGNGDKMMYTELTVDLINDGINEIREEMDKAKQYLEEYEKHAGENESYIQYIVEYKEELKTCENAIHELEFIRTLIHEAGYYNEDDEVTCVEKYIANID